jgi:hypothetical protein
MRNEVEWKITRPTNGGRSSATPELKTIRRLRDTGLAELAPPCDAQVWRATRLRISNYYCDETSFALSCRDLDRGIHVSLRH